MELVLSISAKQQKQTFKVNKSFSTKSEITKRTANISEAFGIGIDEEKHFTVFKQFIVNINKGDLVYVTGDSGGGKSLLLKELCTQMKLHREFGKIINASKLHINPKEVLIEGVGKDTAEAIKTLSSVGLNEAFLFLRKYNELSDGQKYRYRIAKLIDSKAETWILDEFCSTLDRTTAKIVAFCTQKIARKLGKTLIIATTHQDLGEDFGANVLIEKGFGSEVSVRYSNNIPKECSILKEISIQSGSREDYLALEEFHYRAKTPTQLHHIYSAKFDGKVVGAIACMAPYLNLHARNYCLPDLYRGLSRKEKAQRTNRDFIRIARVVVHPKFRSIGLGVKLVKETLPLLDRPYVETLAVMARYNSFFELAGMKRIEPPPSPTQIEYRKKLERLAEIGFDIHLISSKRYNLSILEKLSKEKVELVKMFVLGNCFARGMRSDNELEKHVRNGNIKAIAEALSRHRLEPIYLIWKNPNLRNYPEPLHKP